MESPKNGFFPKGLTHAFGQKMLIFFVYLDLVKIRLEIMLSDFPRKKETFWAIKNRIFQSRKKSHFFSKGFNPGFLSKKAKFFFI